LGKEREREKVHSTLLLSCFVAWHSCHNGG
jgi:hypothetical protein